MRQLLFMIMSSFLDYAMKFLDIREHVLNYLAIRDQQSNTSLAVSKYGILLQILMNYLLPYQWRF